MKEGTTSYGNGADYLGELFCDLKKTTILFYTC